MSDDLLGRAEAWLAEDPDPETRAELGTLIDEARAGASNAIDELHERFDTRLAFGTAGLRGEIAAGPNRMNRVLVGQAAAGLGAFLVSREASPSVVIGYDGRKNSKIFAEDSAAILAGAGVRAILLPRLLPTPVLAFAVRHLDASAGVMVTASHNPPNDNGYKVYLGTSDEGAQIVPPVDAEIAAQILSVAESTTFDALPKAAYETADEAVVSAYIAATASLVAAPAAQPRVVYTAMHGVGWETFSAVIAAAGFDAPTVVSAQIEPDAAFPTVSFPNPEEPGAMDLAFDEARRVGADLVIANDPDADRLAIAIPVEGGYRQLSGNEVGAILGWRAAEEASRRATGDNAAEGTLACSIVSSPALGAIARDYGLAYDETLTGFKWISRADGLIFGFEEALGYLVNPATVRDKDGISAALAFLSLAADLAASGRTIADHLEAFSERFGHFASGQVSLRFTDPAARVAVMAKLRAEPPASVGRFAVERIDDLADGFEGLPPSDTLRFRLEGGARVMVRPSGTEPKLKIYIDAHSESGTAVERKAEAESAVAELAEGMRALTS